MMEAPGASVDPTSSDNHASNNPHSSNPSSPFTIIRFLQAPVTTLIEYAGVSRPRANDDHQESESLISNRVRQDHISSGSSTNIYTRRNGGQVFIRISRGGGQEGEHREQAPVNRSDSSDWHQVPRWIEQMLLFSLLLVIVFIRKHLQGLFLTVYTTAINYKSNDILRKQTALKGERKLNVLAGYCILFMLHVTGVYRWYQNDDILNPLLMLPPKAIPPFWNAIFTIIVNDTMVRQTAMAFKLLLLMYYKNGRGNSFKRQVQMLALVEHALLLYRAFLPAPIWYRFFLDEENGSLFSSLTTGLYFTLKLTSVVEKIRSFYAALKALSLKEVSYVSHATVEQVSEAGDVCAICQEKMQAPILLRCEHIFCEDCAWKWFERERTCPLCRALVRPADLRLFGDGSTSMFLQLF